MSREHSRTRAHILEAVESMLEYARGDSIRISDVAKEANVAVQTIYYYFESREHLVAEAQASAYFKLIVPLHQFLAGAEASIVDRDEEAFLAAIGDNLELSWALGQLDGGWKVTRLLNDVWSHSTTQRAFSDSLDVQLNRWMITIEAAKSLGWIEQEIDAAALIAACWTGSMGQAIFSHSKNAIYTPTTIRDFFMMIVTGKPQQL